MSEAKGRKQKQVEKDVEQTTDQPGVFQWVTLGRLHEDATNFRRVRDAEKLEALAASILEHGVRQTLEVRFLQGDIEREPIYEVVTGNRRLAASRLVVERLLVKADLTEADKSLIVQRSVLPCRILTPEEAERSKELQMIENLQREDVSPIDEAEGFSWLLTHHVEWTVQEVARRIGCSRDHVENRLKLLQAPAELLAEIDAGRVSIRVGEIVGRLPGVEIRREVAARVLSPKYQAEPLRVDEVEEMVRSEYVLGLAQAPFETHDCVPCPHRTANQEGVRKEMGGKGHAGNQCTNPSCYREKAGAWWTMTQRQAEESGVEVLSVTTAAEVYAGPGGTVAVRSPWVDLDDKPGPDDVGHWGRGKLPLWGELAAGLDVPQAIARHPDTGQVRYLARKALLIEAVNQRAMEDGTESPFGVMSEERKRKGAEEEAKKESARLRRDGGVMLLRGVWDRITTEGEIAEGLWQIVAEAVLEDRARLEVMVAMLGLKRQTGDGMGWKGRRVLEEVPWPDRVVFFALLAGSVSLDGATSVVLREVAEECGALEVPETEETVQ